MVHGAAGCPAARTSSSCAAAERSSSDCQAARACACSASLSAASARSLRGGAPCQRALCGCVGSLGSLRAACSQGGRASALALARGQAVLQILARGAASTGAAAFLLPARWRRAWARPPAQLGGALLLRSPAPEEGGGRGRGRARLARQAQPQHLALQVVAAPREPAHDLRLVLHHRGRAAPARRARPPLSAGRRGEQRPRRNVLRASLYEDRVCYP